MIDPFSISFSFDDRRSIYTIMRDEMKEEEERKIAIKISNKRARKFANDEWRKLGLSTKIRTNKERWVKTKSREYFQNHFLDMGNENKREDGDEKEEEERKIREEEERKIREEEDQDFQI